MNLKLPLCPKCLDTKFVQESWQILIVGANPAFYCTNCGIRWETVDVYNGISWKITDKNGVICEGFYK